MYFFASVVICFTLLFLTSYLKKLLLDMLKACSLSFKRFLIKMNKFIVEHIEICTMCWPVLVFKKKSALDVFQPSFQTVEEHGSHLTYIFFLYIFRSFVVFATGIEPKSDSWTTADLRT